MQQLTKKRPWLAAVLASFGTGLGHLYLRRWKRALGWILAVGVAIHLFVSPAAVGAFVTGNGSLQSILPLLVVASLSAADAYLLAYAHNIVVRVTVEPDGTLTHCPRCGKELDSDLDFCHWCTARLDLRDENGASQTADPERRSGGPR